MFINITKTNPHEEQRDLAQTAVLNLPMLRLLSPKAQGRKIF